MAETVAIVSAIIGAAQLAVAVKDSASAPSPEPPSGLKTRQQWLQCTVKNMTQYPLLLQGTYHNSGRFYTAPGSVSSFHQMVFSCCPRDHSFATGVSGGASFRIKLDSEHSFYFAIGWTNPYIGSIKAGVAESGTASDGYEAATDEGSSVNSSLGYTGVDQNGKDAMVHFQVSAIPGQEAAFTVTEIREELRGIGGSWS